MAYESDRVSVGRRVAEIQELCGDKDDNVSFAQRLNAAAHELGFAEAWNPNRLAKVRTGAQGIAVDDMTVVARLDPKQRGYTYVAFGIAVKKGEDAWAVLARMAKKDRSA